MKVKVTLMTENDKHVNATKEEIENAARISWGFLCTMFNNTVNQTETVTVEKCELIEM
jgi:hypothetical protein